MSYIDVGRVMLLWIGIIIVPEIGFATMGLKDGESRAKIDEILRDGIASGRGVHRKWGYPIQKSRSKFGGSSQKSGKIRILGVGVV